MTSTKPTHKNYSHIFFDLDNTLWDSRKNSWHAIKDMFIEKEIERRFPSTSFDDFWPIYNDINEFLWAQLRDKNITKKYLRQQRFKQAFAHFDIHSSPLISWFESNFPKRAIQYNFLVPGAISLLESIKENYKLHILTNGFKEVSYKKIAYTDLCGRFDKIICADELNIRKPDPAIFKYALEMANAKIEESIFIGDDWEADAIGAANIGMRSIFFNPLSLSHYVDDRIEMVRQLEEIKTIL